MKIGVVSDTHRNKDFLREVVEWLVKRQKAGTLYHLGDEYEDVEDIADRHIDIVQVPGTYHPGYLDGTLKPKQMETVLGLNILLVHSFDKDITGEDRARSNIILSGHTHNAELRVEDGVLFMNPGHLKSAMDKHMPPSFGLLDISEKGVVAEIYSLEFRTVQTMHLTRSAAGLFKRG